MYICQYILVMIDMRGPIKFNALLTILKNIYSGSSQLKNISCLFLII